MAEKKPWYENGARPPVPTAEQSTLIANGVGEMLQVISEGMSRVYDAADGIRAELGRRGYSETAAELVAQQHIMLAQQALWGGGSQ